MKRTIICCVVTTLLAVGVCGQDGKREGSAADPAPAHGGKIETKYDGFSRETVVALRKMDITCGGVKGARGAFKETCVSLSASLHCPGKQLDYVRYAKVQLIFEAKDWDSRHPHGERDLTVVADGETLRLGTMKLVNQSVDSGLLDERSKEVLEVSVPYKTFERLARAQAIEMSVGRTAFELKFKNVAALRDLNSRLKF